VASRGTEPRRHPSAWMTPPSSVAAEAETPPPPCCPHPCPRTSAARRGRPTRAPSTTTLAAGCLTYVLQLKFTRTPVDTETEELDSATAEVNPVVAALDSKAAELNFSVVEVNLRNEKVDSLSCKLILSRRRCSRDAHCCAQGLTECGTLPRASRGPTRVPDRGEQRWAHGSAVPARTSRSACSEHESGRPPPRASAHRSCPCRRPRPTSPRRRSRRCRVVSSSSLAPSRLGARTIGSLRACRRPS
jgi:hypothetical protein